MLTRLWISFADAFREVGSWLRIVFQRIVDWSEGSIVVPSFSEEAERVCTVEFSVEDGSDGVYLDAALPGKLKVDLSDE